MFRPTAKPATALALVALTLALAGPVPAAANTNFELPYAEFFDELTKFEGRPNTERLQLRTSLRSKDRDEPLAPVSMTVLTADGPVPVPVDSDNAFVLPMNPAWVGEGAKIHVSHDPDQFSIRVQVGMVMPDPTTLTYADIAAAFAQFDGVISQEAGFFAFAVPSAKVLRIQCGTDCAATLTTPTGQSTIAADDRGRVNIPKDKRLAAENPTITLSHPARYTAISTKD
ncbi:MAG: hypothetical protein RLY86_3899 [Pseudomonadota bacterium]|jgi:hypothetical protein